MATSTGILKTVYDPKTGREFNSPAQAAQYGVKDYVTSLPKNIPLPASTQKVVDEWKIRNPNLTQDEILGVLGGYYSMTGEQFRNYEIQGTIRSADQQIVRNAVATQSGGLAPEQLTAKLQAFKIKPPTTAQEKLQQDALYADYANRYANSSWNYANMGGKPQDFSLKPADYLATSFTGYSEPINFALSNMNQSSPQFAEMSKILTANPEINDVIDQLYKQNPNASIFNSINPKYAGGTEKSTMASNFNVTIKNLAGDIERFGSAEATRRFVDQQKTTANAVAQTAGGLLQTTQPSTAVTQQPATMAAQTLASPPTTMSEPLVGTGSRPENTQSRASKQIIDFLLLNPDMTDAQIVGAMETYKISPAQMATAVGLSEGVVSARIAATIPQGSAKLLGDTWVQPNYQIIGSGQDQQVGGVESVSVYKTTGGINDKLAVGTDVQNYTPTGEFINTSKTRADQSFFGGLVDAFKDPVVLAALGGAAAGGLFGGLGAGGTAATVGADLAGLSGIPAGAGALTAAESAALFGTGGLTTGALTAGGLGTGITAGAGGLGLSTTGAGLGAAGTGAGITAGAGLTGTGVLAGSGLGTALLGTGAGALTGTGILAGSGLGTALLGTGAGTGVTGALTTGVGAGLGTGLGTGALSTGVGTGVGTALGTAAGTGLGGLTAAQIGALLTGGLTTGAGLLQQQTSKDAAVKAQAMIDTETAAAKKAAQFKPVGMTTRFGSSQFVVDPTTGQLTSAGYTLSPEAKNAQDRFVKLAEAGLVQAEGAQKAFAPLQTGAESLFKLGQGYLAKTPEDVAKDYLASQMALLQPGRELELANLQNKLQQQGRGGLSVAQGGTYGATTPELQALYNARAQQEAILAANAQQAGQKDVLFGAGLLGQGATAMGNYYTGQQGAYAPYTTALTQVKDLETLAQKPITMATDLAQLTSAAGAKIGDIGLKGAGQSVALATGPAATTNPYSTLLSGLGSSPAFGQALGGLFS